MAAKKPGPSGPPTPQPPVLRGRGTSALSAKQPASPGARAKPLPPRLPLATTATATGDSSLPATPSNFWSPASPGPQSAGPVPKRSAAASAAATLLKIHGGPASAPQSPVMTPPPRTSSLSPQSSPTGVYGRGFSLLKGGPHPAGNTAAASMPSPRSPSAPPASNGLKRSMSRGAASSSNGCTSPGRMPSGQPGLRPKLSAPNLTLPGSNKPRCIIPPPPMDPPPEHLVKAQQQQQLRQQAHLGAPRVAPPPPSPRTSSLAGRPAELQRSYSASAVVKSPEHARRPPGSPLSATSPSPPVQPPLVRASSLHAVPSARRACPPGSPASSHVPRRPPANNTSNSINSAPTTPTNASPPAQRGWRSRAEEAISQDNGAAHGTTGSASPASSSAGRTCDQCQGTGVRTIARMVTGPSTSGSAVCSQCRGKRVLHN
ncbi:hypothetical protein SYNPS1DRAFT_31566 [Syncephalis pseudoplumigaleata]|uniref:Uncharacterized protein n=1 Tax=Syncephalis pseudoplumigaleata TaxID=1712513 RepID=A0A4P9YSE6_9FUNG|nr:hypothetical protein SYNPS1DRAFT_31566 [Syncephalis pseudoplumigaleata]|eukprot:RKP22787.1 hypothetical protein SYNPS1DRAFT_31566 [Syncephalis pseudoplumigaleata]